MGAEAMVKPAVKQRVVARMKTRVRVKGLDLGGGGAEEESEVVSENWAWKGGGGGVEEVVEAEGGTTNRRLASGVTEKSKQMSNLGQKIWIP